MGGAFSAHGIGKNCWKHLNHKTWVRESLRDIGVDGMIKSQLA